MSSRRVRIIVLAGVVLIVLVIAYSLIVTYGMKKTTYALLPAASAASSGGQATASGGSVSNNSGLNSISVTTGNVQAVIASLLRPDSYARSIRVDSFFGDTSAAYNIVVTVIGSDSAMKISNGGEVKHIILAGGKLYIWYEGDSDYRALPAEALGGAPNLSDEFQKIPTYEDILKPDVSIQNASLVTSNGEQRIRVRYVSGILKYTTAAEISIATGLLVNAEQYDGDRLVYRMTTSDFRQPVQDNSAFGLPDGKAAR